MALTKVTSGVRTLGTGEVTAANLASDAVPGVTSNQDDIALLGFKVAANGSLAKYNLVDQTIDAFEDASGVDASTSTDELRNAANYYSGSSSTSGNASGDGTQTTHGAYTVDTFLADGDWIAPSSNTVATLVVAGGGGGGGGNTSPAGGGGAGGMVTSTSVSATAQTYAIVVGDGGAGGAVGDNPGTDGSDSSALGLSATGGGGGGSNSYNGRDGGSGGGTGHKGSGTGGSAEAGEGNDGGSCTSPTGPNQNAGGGGGKGGAGSNGTTASGGTGGNGGAGATNDYRTGSAVYYAAGGGGAGWGVPGTGGSSIGGDGTYNTTPGNGVANTGSGGGGGNETAGGSEIAGGNAGSGIVVIRYTTDSFTTAVVSDMTLVSNATTAQDGAPTTGDLVITYTDGAGTASVNTDIKAYISRNGSAYTSAVTLVSQGTTGGHTILTANGVDLSGITTGTSMRWKIETLNQSAAKETRIQAVSLGWS